MKFEGINTGQRLAEWQSLLDLAFPTLPEGSFLDDFPVWGPDSEARIYRAGCYPDGALAATASARLATLSLGSGTVRAGIIGAVATAPDWRRRGLASRAVQEVEHWLVEQGVSVILLWGSEHSMYGRLGYELCGTQYQLSLKPFAKGELASGVTVETGWDDAIFGLMKGRRSGLALKHQDRSWISAHKNTLWMRAMRGKETLAYTAFGRGADLPNLVHEFGGDPTALIGLMGHIYRAVPEAGVLASAPALEGLGVTPDQFPEAEYLCLAKVIDPSELFQAVYPKVAFDCEAAGEGYRIRIGEGLFDGQSNHEIAKFLFGPGISAEMTRAGLPLPLWIWGLDAA